MNLPPEMHGLIILGLTLVVIKLCIERYRMKTRVFQLHLKRKIDHQEGTYLLNLYMDEYKRQFENWLVNGGK